MRNNRDIKCVVSEPHTGEAVENFTVSVSVTSHFSRLRLQPARGLNFGAVKYNEEPKVRRFELKNEGLFEFKYAICDDCDLEAKARIKEERQKEQEERISGAQEAADADPKAAAKGGKKPDPKAAKPGKGAKEGGPPDGAQLTCG